MEGGDYKVSTCSEANVFLVRSQQKEPVTDENHCHSTTMILHYFETFVAFLVS